MSPRRNLAELRGHLRVINVKCDRCKRFGRYNLEREIRKFSPNENLLDWVLRLTEDCPVRTTTPGECAAGLPDIARIAKRLR